MKIVFCMMNFHLGNVAPNWIKMMVENTKGKVILFMNEREKEFCPEGIKAYYFPTELYEQQKEKYISEDEFAFEVSINGNADIEEFYVKKLEEIRNEQGEIILYLSEKNRALELAAEKLHVLRKYIELSAFRRRHYYNYNMCLFQDDTTAFANEECKSRYLEFSKQKEDSVLKQMLTAKELMLLGIKETDVVVVMQYMGKKCSDADIGLALPRDDRQELYPGWTRKKIVEIVEEKYKEENIIYKLHPDDQQNQNKYLKARDFSNNPLRFISRCKSTVSIASNLAFEGMLLGKRVIDLARTPYADKIVTSLGNDEECSYTDEYLNYLLFSFFVPFELLGDIEYVKWRLDNKTREIDRFNFSVKYICENWLKCSVDELNQATNKYDFIVQKRKFSVADNRNYLLDILDNVASIQWENRTTYICGTGKDASKIANILTKLEANIEGFVVMDDKTATGNLFGIPVLAWQDLEYSLDDVFVVSQQTIDIQLIVLETLQKAGIENIIVV